MLNWLVRFWQRLDAWMHRRTISQYNYRQRSNLHGRHR